MDFDLGADADALRHRLRRLVADHLPPGYLGAFTDDPADLEVAQRFCRRLAAEGLLTLAWPRRYGGTEMSVWDQTVLREEMWAHHEPRGAQYMGLNWVGPAIMAFGTEAQKRRFLPPIAAGEVVWCQGFSEPGAGSDLAALSTRAVPDGDGFRISGQKIWTSYALMAQWCVVAARVGTTAGDRHRGITLLLVAMDRPGITVRPIASMLGPHHLNEVFFDDVWAAGDEVLGGVGNGWAVMRRALAHERVGIARYARADRLLSEVGAAAGGLGAVGAPLRVPWARALVQARVARLLAYRAVAAQQGEAAGGAGAAGSAGAAAAGSGGAPAAGSGGAPAAGSAGGAAEVAASAA
ncbi:MAG TPA: acyl-CoA dehydrogenase family protein, partial [Acidimicrobiales bacterium]|nr:acyl-CoA dehydrogenase family protein [Acidimicrobiales bacterium]